MDTQDFDIAGVTFESARDWLQGKFNVGNSIDDSPLDQSRPEIVFLNELGNRTSYRAAVAEIVRLARLGAKGVAAHAVGDLMISRYKRQGCLVALVETIQWRGVTYQAARMFSPPQAFQRWLAKIHGS